LTDCVEKVRSGRVFKVMGDGLLAEFPSAVLALRAALGIRQRMRGHNDKVAEAERVELRIGVRQGDVVVEGSDLLGDALPQIKPMKRSGGQYRA
jgi:class 3 adenylate cyclase